MNGANRLVLIVIALGLSCLQHVQAQQLGPDPSMIKSIYFSGGRYYIDPYQAEELKEFIKSFPNIRNYTITVHSHTDNRGGVEMNQMLSEMRSYMAIQNLVKFEVPNDIISIHDFGEYNPVYDNSTYQGRQMNRRVDIILWSVETL
jgi:outer membrane protein OmpA-like peptidoglycan-associated protein